MQRYVEFILSGIVVVVVVVVVVTRKNGWKSVSSSLIIEKTNINKHRINFSSSSNEAIAKFEIKKKKSIFHRAIFSGAYIIEGAWKATRVFSSTSKQTLRNVYRKCLISFQVPVEHHPRSFRFGFSRPTFVVLYFNSCLATSFLLRSGANGSYFRFLATIQQLPLDHALSKAASSPLPSFHSVLTIVSFSSSLLPPTLRSKITMISRSFPSIASNSV